MSEYNHIDKKEYLILGNERWRVWNNGIIEKFYGGKWEEQNPNQSWKDRLELLKLWEKAEIGKKYDFNWIYERKIFEHGIVPFLGFREQCPECKKSYLIWEGKIQLCKNCDYIHAFEYDDST